MTPTRIGQVFRGGTFAGFVRVNNHINAIIVAPKSAESVTGESCPSLTTTTPNDGYFNTHSTPLSNNTVQKYCVELVCNEFQDWYLPSRDELVLCFINLRSTEKTDDSINEFREVNTLVPATTVSAPLKPSVVTSYSKVGIERFDKCSYRSSTEVEHNHAWSVGFGAAFNYPVHHYDDWLSVRPVRRECIV